MIASLLTGQGNVPAEVLLGQVQDMCTQQLKQEPGVDVEAARPEKGIKPLRVAPAITTKGSYGSGSGSGSSDGSSSGSGSGSRVAPRSKAKDRCLVYYELQDDWCTGLPPLDSVLWQILAVLPSSGRGGTTSTAVVAAPVVAAVPLATTSLSASLLAAAAPAVPTASLLAALPTNANTNSNSTGASHVADGAIAGGSGVGTLINQPTEVNFKIRGYNFGGNKCVPTCAAELFGGPLATSGLGMAAGPWEGGNVIELWLSTPDIIRLTRDHRMYCEGLVVSSPVSSYPGSRGAEEERVNATCTFTFRGQSGDKTVEAKVLGVVEKSCSFAFKCIVPKCPFPIDSSAGTMLAHVQVRAWMKVGDGDAGAASESRHDERVGAARSARDAATAATARPGRALFPRDEVDEVGEVGTFAVEDATVHGGYLYLANQYQARAAEVMSFGMEVQSLRADGSNGSVGSARSVGSVGSAGSVDAVDDTSPEEMSDADAADFSPDEMADAAACAAAHCPAEEAGVGDAGGNAGGDAALLPMNTTSDDADDDDLDHQQQGRLRQRITGELGGAHAKNYREYRSGVCPSLLTNSVAARVAAQVTKSATQQPGSKAPTFRAPAFRAPASYRENVVPRTVENRLPGAFMTKMKKLGLEEPGAKHGPNKLVRS
jgi:hypothetical protein